MDVHLLAQMSTVVAQSIRQLLQLIGFRNLDVFMEWHLNGDIKRNARLSVLGMFAWNR